MKHKYSSTTYLARHLATLRVIYQRIYKVAKNAHRNIWS